METSFDGTLFILWLPTFDSVFVFVLFNIIM